MSGAKRARSAEPVAAEPAAQAPAAPAEPTALATTTEPSLPADTRLMLDTLESMAGSGMEKAGAQDILIPRLTIIQQLSDQHKQNNPSYNSDAKDGDVIDVATNEIMPRPLHVVPVTWSKSWLEWAPRNTQRGLVAIHPTEDIMRDSRPNPAGTGAPVLPNGNLIVETAQWYVLNLMAEGRPSFIPMSSTAIRASRKWMTLAQGQRLRNSRGIEFTPPLFFRTYKLNTQLVQKGNNQWYGWTVQPDVSIAELPDGENLLRRCIAFRDSLTEGQMRADMANATDDPSVVEHEGDEKPM